MADDTLPPLPSKAVVNRHLPTGIAIHAYTAEQMHAYARTAIAERDETIALLRDELQLACELKREYQERADDVEAENDTLCKANEAFSKRQEWWTERMFTLEQERDALRAEVEALRGRRHDAA